MHRILGAYLIGIAAIQLTLYVWALATGSSSLFYVDPRVGLAALEEALFPRAVYPGPLVSASAIAVGVIGLQVRHSPERVRRYLVLEPVMALPTVPMVLAVTVANVGPTHALSVDELVMPSVVLVATTIVPYGMARRIRSALKAAAAR